MGNTVNSIDIFGGVASAFLTIASTALTIAHHTANITAAITSTPPTIAIAPYAAPKASAPESPGKIRVGIL